MWFKAEGFQEKVKLWGRIISLTPSYVLTRKLSIEGGSTEMKKEKFGNVGVGKKSILDGLKELDKNEVSTVPLVEERLQRDERSQNSKKLYIYK